MKSLQEYKDKYASIKKKAECAFCANRFSDACGTCYGMFFRHKESFEEFLKREIKNDSELLADKDESIKEMQKEITELTTLLNKKKIEYTKTRENFIKKNTYKILSEFYSSDVD